MASRINADSSNGLQLVSDSSGEVQIQSNGVTVATINSSGLSMNSGTLAGNGPAFRATASTSQTFTGGVAQKVTLGTEVWDTNSNFDNVTNYRFTPTVAGYYQVNGGYSFTTAGSAGWTLFTYIAKNGSEHIRGTEMYSLTGTFNQSVVNGVVYMNGTTDYIELYAMSIGGNINTGSTGFLFYGCNISEGSIMTLYEKIKVIYPELTNNDFLTVIRLQNDSDGKGDYIAKWEHPTLAKPTQEELDNV